MATCGPQSAERERQRDSNKFKVKTELLTQFHGYGKNRYLATVAHLKTHTSVEY
jgi:hypothetical protein